MFIRIPCHTRPVNSLFSPVTQVFTQPDQYTTVANPSFSPFQVLQLELLREPPFPSPLDTPPGTGIE